MAENGYDAVIVGARCAGSPVAAKLAEGGWKVLMLDRDPPPADTVSTHFVFPNTLERLAEMGALERIEREHRLNFLLHRVQILGHEAAGPYTEIGGFDRGLGITRPVLDQALLEIALDAGAETRFGKKVVGLVGSGTEDDPVAGVELDDGERIEAQLVIGADGRASTVAGALELEKTRPMAGEFSILFAYWRGDRDEEFMHIDAREDLALTWGQCEDDVHLIAINGAAEFTRGSTDERERRYLEGVRSFPDTVPPDWLERSELISPIVVAPETMMRGFFRQASGPGWALVGDAGHFKHPATAQGISDAIEQGRYLAEALQGADPDLEGYESWRDGRAAEHYEWSFDFGSFPKPEVAHPLFTGIENDEQAAQDLRDSMSRLVEPRSGVFTKERLSKWFAAATVDEGAKQN